MPSCASDAKNVRIAKSVCERPAERVTHRRITSVCWALTGTFKRLTATPERFAATYDAHMKRLDPMGLIPRYVRPTPPAPVTIMVSKAPGGWFLFTRHFEIDQDPHYGKDENGWCGYYFRPDQQTAQDLLAMAEYARKKAIASGSYSPPSPN